MPKVHYRKGGGPDGRKYGVRFIPHMVAVDASGNSLKVYGGKELMTAFAKRNFVKTVLKGIGY